MSAAVIDGDPRGRKIRICEGAHGHGHVPVVIAFLGVEESRAANRAEPEGKPRALITGADVVSGYAEDGVRRGEIGQRREHAARPALARQTMADANAARFA